MIQEPSFLHVFYRGHSASSSVIWWYSVLAAAWGAVVVVLDRMWFQNTTISPLPLTSAGVPLGVFLGFRSTHAYDRYWDARTRWAELANASRSFTRDILALVRSDENDAEELSAWHEQMVFQVIAFCYALRAHLQETDPVEATRDAYPSAAEGLEQVRSVPFAVLRPISFALKDVFDRGWLHPFHIHTIEQRLIQMTEVQGACERIRTTPLPVPYSLLTQRLVLIYVIGMPIAIVDAEGWLTPFVSFIIAYVFFGLNLVSNEIAHPFRPGPNQLPMLTICREIEADLKQAVGRTDLPELPAVEDGLVP